MLHLFTPVKITFKYVTRSQNDHLGLQNDNLRYLASHASSKLEEMDFKVACSEIGLF